MDMRTVADIKQDLASVLGVLQLSIIDLAVKKEVDSGRMTESDLEDLHFVIGTAQVTSANLEMFIHQPPEFFTSDQVVLAIKLFREATGFATQLQAEGYGKAN